MVTNTFPFTNECSTNISKAYGNNDGLLEIPTTDKPLIILLYLTDVNIRNHH
ncbi:hypothetical protein SAMN04488097_2076 [Epilithonimonas lactis]|nr:hypothetical protein SAMN04488097_2076 [Epilithonimonas lactis]